jgi:hypothetical protein
MILVNNDDNDGSDGDNDDDDDLWIIIWAIALQDQSPRWSTMCPIWPPVIFQIHSGASPPGVKHWAAN